MAALAAAIQRMVRSANRGMASRYDTVRFGILDVLKQRGPVRLSDLAVELDVNPSSVSRRMQELEEAGIVVLAANPEDGRSSLAALTEAGLGEWQQFHESGITATAHVLHDWSETDIRELTRLLSRLIDAWEHAPAGDLSQQTTRRAAVRKRRT